MGTLNAFYVRAATPDAAIIAIRAKFRVVKVLAGTEFRGVQLPGRAYKPPERLLLELSLQQNSDVIWLSFQSAVDAFQFHHWRAGLHLRSLVYGCFAEERTWERAEGDTEPWEREVFFGQSELEQRLKHLESDDEKRELEGIWRKAEIHVGRPEPVLNGRECARKVAELIHFPGWE